MKSSTSELGLIGRISFEMPEAYTVKVLMEKRRSVFRLMEKQFSLLMRSEPYPRLSVQTNAEVSMTQTDRQYAYVSVLGLSLYSTPYSLLGIV